MNDIVQQAVAAGNFKTLIQAVRVAGLEDTLKGPGPFTLFAPTDEAFAKLPKATLDGVLKDKDKLKAILNFHVLSGRVSSKDVMTMNGQAKKTVQGGSLRVDTSHGVHVGTAKVVETDIQASNGVIHSIDTVQMPS